MLIKSASTVALLIFCTAAVDPTTMPATTRPAVAVAPTTRPDSAAAVLSRVDSAYAGLKSAAFSGTIVGHFDVAGKKQDESASFTSTFAAPNKFRHETKGDVEVGSTGTQAYAMLPGRKEYLSVDAPKGRAPSSEWPANVTTILSQQNPSILLAASKSARNELNELSKTITLLPDVTIDGVACPTLKFGMSADQPGLEMSFDPTTFLIRQLRYDYKSSLEKSGTTEVVAATVTVTYDHADPAATPVDNAFAWTAPTGAVLVSAATDMAQAGDDAPDAFKELIGKAAPDFSLKNLKGDSVKLSDQKGSVVVLDFWATWCGPCVQSLPHLNTLYKDESPNGLKVFAVNLQEDADTVQPFVTTKKWTLPILLDSDGAVAGKYKATAIPETVVVGKDGNIKAVFIGSGNEEKIKAAVEKEMK